MGATGDEEEEEHVRQRTRAAAASAEAVMRMHSHCVADDDAGGTCTRYLSSAIQFCSAAIASLTAH